LLFNKAMENQIIEKLFRLLFMNIEETIKYWLDSADNDFKTAKSLFDSAHYDW